jgi:quercetin dioxygenase-like cupin family protein
MSKVIVMEGVVRETLAVGKDLMIVEFTFAKGAEVPWHTHVHEQSSYIVKGCLKLMVDEKEIILTKGMSAIVPPNAKHKAIALEDTIDLNSFTPIREDYLK